MYVGEISEIKKLFGLPATTTNKNLFETNLFGKYVDRWEPFSAGEFGTVVYDYEISVDTTRPLDDVETDEVAIVKESQNKNGTGYDFYEIQRLLVKKNGQWYYIVWRSEEIKYKTKMYTITEQSIRLLNQFLYFTINV